ncbi:MAG: LysR family transcriptional regulator [Clostridiales bacterium]|nr:LysR family transcriptional regulator [Clostridiales bacterium]
MNILHLKYAVEVARLGSLNKAAETLLTAQPNISRSIKELESDLGITIFSRSAKGMVLTPEGEELIEYAQGILKQIEQVEKIYKDGYSKKQKFSISVPRACYISEAFTEFSKDITYKPAEFYYNETNSGQVINNVLNNDYALGIIRYLEKYDKFFKETLEEKGLCYEMISEFSKVLIMSKDNPLASRESVCVDDLIPFIEIVYADPYVPSLPVSKIIKDEFLEDIDKRIYVFERAGRFELLAENTKTFTWGSAVPQKTLDRYGLVQKKCVDDKKVYKDVLIYKNGYNLTKLDKQFITALITSRRKYL